jgi:DNA-binding CsgD family transcriptional regulator
MMKLMKEPIKYEINTRRSQMPNGIDLKRHISLASSHDIANITSPLKKHFGITYFNYVKLYKNGGRLLLTDRADWIDYFYKNALYETKVVSTLENLDAYSYHLWQEFAGQPSFVIGKEKFNIYNGITIIEPNKDYTELYYFGTTVENVGVVSLYINKFDILQRFLLYFKDKAHDLVSEANRHLIHLPHNGSITAPSEELIDDAKYQSFLAETPINRVFISEISDIYLTNREATCLYLLLQNNTAKKIGKILNISPRTVESYLEAIKMKFNLDSKKELIKIAEILGLREKLANVCVGL